VESIARGGGGGGGGGWEILLHISHTFHPPLENASMPSQQAVGPGVYT
jgi:hypothetical protein